MHVPQTQVCNRVKFKFDNDSADASNRDNVIASATQSGGPRGRMTRGRHTALVNMSVTTSASTKKQDAEIRYVEQDQPTIAKNHSFIETRYLFYVPEHSTFDKSDHPLWRGGGYVSYITALPKKFILCNRV